MSELAVAAQSGSSPLTTMLRRTVAVVDMVGYSDVARMLEQNISALSVADLNRQIQTFITRSLDRLSNQQAFRIVARTGDGIIVLFDHPDEAHDFAYHVHLFAAEHNNQRSESTAERWFRIGIATGDVSATACADRAPEFAGITIANAVRLESKAKSGEILIDITTFDLLPPESRLLYASARAVPGKRKELFRARSFRVSCPRVPSRIPVHPLITRRVFLGAATATLASTTLAAWLERDRLYARLHPLPDIRHIALMAWPRPAKESEVMLADIMESIRARLIHAERYADKFIIVTAEEVARSAGALSRESSADRSPGETADQWGANLILAANLIQHKTSPMLELKVLDTNGYKIYRQDRLPIAPTEIAQAASQSAARLLDLPLKEIKISDESELANQPEAARNLYAEAKLIGKDPNHAGTLEAIQKYQDLVNDYPNFSLAHSGLGGQCLIQYRKSRDPKYRELADQSSLLALERNPDSDAARLIRAKFLIATKDPKKVPNQQLAEPQHLLEAILRNNPMNTEAVFAQAEVFQQLGDAENQRAVYEAVIHNRPNFWCAYNDLGNMFHKSGNDKKALEFYSKASARAPRATVPLINLGTMYLLLKRPDEAKAAFEASNALSPSETAFENLGTIAFEKKDYPGALQLYLKAKALSSSNYFVLADLGDTYEKLNNPKMTLDCYNDAAERLHAKLTDNPRSAYDWMLLAFYYAKVSHYAKDKEQQNAYQNADSAISASGQHIAIGKGPDVSTRFLEARALMLLGRTKKAEDKLLGCLDDKLNSTEVELAPEFDSFRTTDQYTARNQNASQLEGKQ